MGSSALWGVLAEDCNFVHDIVDRFTHLESGHHYKMVKMLYSVTI